MAINIRVKRLRGYQCSCEKDCMDRISVFFVYVKKGRLYVFIRENTAIRVRVGKKRTAICVHTRKHSYLSSCGKKGRLFVFIRESTAIGARVEKRTAINVNVGKDGYQCSCEK